MSLSDFDPNSVIHLVDGETLDLALGELVDKDTGEPNGELLTLHVVAHALARVSRFGGHYGTVGHYSVAEHAVLVASLVRDHFKQPEYTLAALHHDDVEGLGLGDIPTPAKQYLKAQGFDYRAFEKSFVPLVSKSFDIPMDDFAAGVIHDADALAYAAECELLKPGKHGPLPEIEPLVLEGVMARIQGFNAPDAELVYGVFHKRLLQIRDGGAEGEQLNPDQFIDLANPFGGAFDDLPTLDHNPEDEPRGPESD